MARPANPKRREEIALAAFDVIRQRGAHRATMSDIATALGMKRPTLYWYFSDLGQIFEAVMRHTMEDQATFVATRLAACDHPIDRLRAWMTAIGDFFESRPNFLILLGQFWAAGQSDAPNRVIDLARSYFEPVHSLAIADLAAGIEAGTVAPCEPETVVDLVACLTDGLLIHHIVRGTDPAPCRALVCERLLEPLRLGGPT